MKNQTMKLSFYFVLVLFTQLCLMDKAIAATYRVKRGATGANNGSTWADAYTDLQTALNNANAGDEIWVAANTYKPTAGTDRTISFVMMYGVALYGGFAGTETARTERDWIAHPTILSGDIGISGNMSDNSYHVVIGETATLDGFTIKNGCGSWDYPGGGMFNTSVSPTIKNCTFIGNKTVEKSGGAIRNIRSSPTIENCIFNANDAPSGGAIYNETSSPIISDCIFINNTSAPFFSSGGGMYNTSGSAPTVTNCVFKDNSESGIVNDASSPTIINCVFHGNSSSSGGGIYNMGGSPQIINCTLNGNSATFGGGMRCDSGSPLIRNCIFWGNSASSDPEFYKSGGTPTFYHCDISGCGGSGSQWTSDIGLDGGGNIDNIPGFVDSTHPAGADGNWLTADDGLALLVNSLCKNTGDPTNAPTDDILGNLRDSQPDIGAYEYQSPPTISFSPSSLSPSCQQGQNAASQSFDVWNSGGGTLSYTISDNANWLSENPFSGSSTAEHDTITVTYNTAGLSAGNYNATITITAGGATNTPRTIPVTLSVIAPLPTISFNPASLSPSCQQGQNAANQSFDVWNSGGGTLSYTISDNAGWLSENPSNGSSTGEHDTITVNYSTSGLSAGNYNATITVTASGATNTPQTISVTLTVTPPLPTISFTPASLSPSCQRGQNAVNQTFQVWNSGGGTLSYTISDNAGWLFETPSSGSSTGEHDTITVNYSTSGLSAGDYNATITITASGATNTPQTIPVTLTVNPPPPTISFTPASLSPSCQQGQNAASQTFEVWNSGGGTLNYTISDSMGWLSETPSNGSSTGEHDTITVNYNTSGLSTGNYTATISISANGATNTPQPISVTLTVNVPTRVIYVKSNATGANDGSSWADAFTDLQPALAVAQWGDEIWIATGTYKPTSGTDRNASFMMIAGAALYGGFAGTETSRQQRNWVGNPTILSGDIGASGDISDNSYHVVRGAYRAILDGFTVSGGNTEIVGSGGGMYNENNTSLTVINCTFSGNTAAWRGGAGGGMYNHGGSVLVTNCTFDSNQAIGGNGGGMLNYQGSVVVLNSIFINNTATYGGNDVGGHGGGMYNSIATVTVANSVFSGNKAIYNGTEVAGYGGGIYNPSHSNSPLTVDNCIFSGNTATFGGGIYNDLASGSVINCTFNGNTASYGGGMNNSAGSIINCILWGNTATYGPEVYKSGGTPTYYHCDIRGSGGSGDLWDSSLGADGGGNILNNPQFADSAHHAGMDGIWMTTDDGLALLSNSPCVNAGVTTGSPDTDILGSARSGMPDIGAYEFQGGNIVIDPLNDALIPNNHAYTGPTPGISGTPPITWSLVQGPSGMIINSNNGIVSWPNPTTTGTPFMIVIQASNVYGHKDASWKLRVFNPFNNVRNWFDYN